MPRKKGSSVLVTGGAGFIGSHLVDRLVEEGYRVTVIDDLSNGRKSYVNPKAKFHKLGLSTKKFAEVFRRTKPEVVFHLAAKIDVPSSVEDPMWDAHTNIHGALHVLDLAVKHGTRKLVFSSSGGAIYHGTKVRPTPESAEANPLDPYGVAKLAFEHYLHTAEHHHGLKSVSLRYANVYGPRQDQKGEGGVIGVFAKMMAEGRRPTIFGDGRQTRDFTYVGDVVEANLAAMRKSVTGVFNISTGKETSVNAVARFIARETGMTKGPKRGKARPGEERRSVLDPRLAKRKLGWKAKVGIEEGIRRTVVWFLSQ